MGSLTTATVSAPRLDIVVNVQYLLCECLLSLFCLNSLCLRDQGTSNLVIEQQPGTTLFWSSWYFCTEPAQLIRAEIPP